MFGVGWPEAIVIAIALIFFFGAKKIPEMGSALGKSLRSFKDELDRPSLDRADLEDDEERS